MKTYLLIGAGPGMGVATAERFAREGYRIVLGSRSAGNVQKLAEELKAKGYTAEAKAVDASDPESIAKFIKAEQKANGGLDVVHYHAASMRQSCIFNQPANTFNSDLAVNVGGAMAMIASATPEMVSRGSGSIFVTGGGFAFNPPPDFISLGVGKAALRSLVQGLHEDFKSKGVHLATVTVAKLVSPKSEDSAAVADRFWELHSQPRDQWAWEIQYA